MTPMRLLPFEAKAPGWSERVSVILVAQSDIRVRELFVPSLCAPVYSLLDFTVDHEPMFVGGGPIPCEIFSGLEHVRFCGRARAGQRIYLQFVATARPRFRLFRPSTWRLWWRCLRQGQPRLVGALKCEVGS